MQDIGLHQLAEIYPRMQALQHDQLQPGHMPVKLTCVHGHGVDTDQAYYYGVDFLQAQTAPEPTATKTTDGDGTVSARSLEVRTHCRVDVWVMLLEQSTARLVQRLAAGPLPPGPVSPLG